MVFPATNQVSRTDSSNLTHVWYNFQAFRLLFSVALGWVDFHRRNAHTFDFDSDCWKEKLQIFLIKIKLFWGRSSHIANSRISMENSQKPVALEIFTFTYAILQLWRLFTVCPFLMLLELLNKMKNFMAFPTNKNIKMSHFWLGFCKKKIEKKKNENTT